MTRNADHPAQQGLLPCALRLLPRLALADLLHQWGRTACLVLSFVAILTPLLVLMGLRFGVVETLRHRLLDDPRNLEIRPLGGESYDAAWFERVEGWEEVRRVIPVTRQIAGTVILDKVPASGAGQSQRADVLATAQADPLLQGFNVPQPQGMECVLTERAASALDVGPGATVAVTVRRLWKSGAESRGIEVRVAGILPLRADPLTRLYVPLDVAENIEAYKDGLAVPQYGWPGTPFVPPPRYAALAVVFPPGAAKRDPAELMNELGLAGLAPMAPQALKAATGLSPAPGVQAYEYAAAGGVVDQQLLQRCVQRLAPGPAWVVPLLDGLPDARLETPDGDELGEVPVRAWPVDVGNVGDAVPAFEGLPLVEEGGGVLRVLLPADAEGPGERRATLVWRSECSGFRCPVTAVFAGTQGARALFHPELAGMLAQAARRTVVYDAAGDMLLLQREGHAGFRLYARGLEDVLRIKDRFGAEGLEVRTQAQRIGDVMALDRHLGILFWLIASVVLLGGGATLIVDLYSAVSSQRKGYSALRLLGMPESWLLALPVCQALCIALTGFSVSCGAFLALSWTIDTLFAGHLEIGESFCRLTAGHMLRALGASLVLAVGAALLAALRVRLIELERGLRDG